MSYVFKKTLQLIFYILYVTVYSIESTGNKFDNNSVFYGTSSVILQGQCHKISFFFMNQFPPTTITAISNFFENSRRFRGKWKNLQAEKFE